MAPLESKTSPGATVFCGLPGAVAVLIRGPWGVRCREFVACGGQAYLAHNPLSQSKMGRGRESNPWSARASLETPTIAVINLLCAQRARYT